ncbi:unnamed protein product [Gemmata massiliana]|uniref:Uncharacterized protein n=1 Tax=Gemmata massiliana TaxID=1210884 RepID=A0A6P2CWZ7_9BACT|nr:hypothetical protein [Gemmata massiliana]VTR93423.1 unnamed protein product [Gemmata massiliana]
MHPHPDDLDGLDDYDRLLVSDMDYSRPLYAPGDTSSGDARLIEDVSRASAAHVYGDLAALAALSPREGFERLADHFRSAFCAYFDGRAGWPGGDPG